MERELLSLGLCSVAILGGIAVNSSAVDSLPQRKSFVRALRDFEPNNVQANSSTVSPRQQLSISGSLSQRSDIDNYVFTVNGQAKSLVINTTNNPSRVSYAVLEDRNNNGRRDSSDPVILLSSAGKTTPTQIELRGRKRLLMQVFGNQRSSASAYGFRVVASEQRSDSDVGIRIRRAVAYPTARFDNRTFASSGSERPDFYVKVNMDSRNLLTTRTVGNRNEPIFNQQNLRRIPGSQGEVKFEITLMDADPGRDDKADASPIRNERTFKVRYLTSTREIIGPDNKVIGKMNSSGSSPIFGRFGDDRSRAGRVEFQILHQGVLR